MSQNNEEEEEPKIFNINVNLSKINITLVITCILLSFYKNDYEYVRAVYNSLFTILIYNNIVFIYILFINRSKL
jgi:hypothetical protein